MTQEISEQSKELFRLVAENVQDFAIFVADLEGRHVSWNPGVERLLGYDEAEWVGLHASLIFTPEDRQRRALEGEMETAMRQGRAEDRRWHVRKDGTRFWANGLLMLLRDEAGGRAPSPRYCATTRRATGPRKSCAARTTSWSGESMSARPTCAR